MRILNFGSLNIDYVYQVDHFIVHRSRIIGHTVQPGGGHTSAKLFHQLARPHFGIDTFQGSSFRKKFAQCYRKHHAHNQPPESCIRDSKASQDNDTHQHIHQCAGYEFYDFFSHFSCFNLCSTIS